MTESTTVNFVNGSSIVSASTTSTDSISFPVISYQYNYDMPDHFSISAEDLRWSAEQYVYGENNFSVRYGYTGYEPLERKIDRKSRWYQPIKDWFKFSWKVLS